MIDLIAAAEEVCRRLEHETASVTIIEQMALREALDGFKAKNLMIVPEDDDTQPFVISRLSRHMIDAGEDVYDQVQTDLRDYVAGETIDWSTGMVVVAIYRAMTKAFTSAGDKMPLKTKVQIEITPQQICDLFITAVEGGSTYWCVKMRFHNLHGQNLSYQDVKTFEGRSWCVEVWTDDQEDDEPFTIVVDDLLRAYEARPFDLEDYDAENADCLVQQAAFGDIVYG